MIIDEHLSSFNPDINELLSKLSETRGYAIIVLTDQDDIKKVPSPLAAEADMIMSKNSVLLKMRQ